MVVRYIKTILKYLNSSSIEYEINLVTPVYNSNSFGYSKTTKEIHQNLKNVNIIEIDNGSDGKTGFGSVENWETISKNTADYLNGLNFSDYNQVITICNDTPFAGLAQYLKKFNNHKLVWIPHSTTLIFPNENLFDVKKEIEWEQNSVNFINKTSGYFVGSICNYMKKHLIENYKVKDSKILEITNGEIFEQEEFAESQELKNLFEKINKYEQIVFSFARAEKAKNLESVMMLKEELKIPTIVIARTYGEHLPIIDDYEFLAKKYNCDLFVDPYYNFSKYILKHFNKKMIVIIPSTQEPMGLIINEVRKLNRDNILIVANNCGGLTEQIEDTKDGLLIDLNNLKLSAKKIKKYFNKTDMALMNKQSQKTIKEKYDITKNMSNLLNQLLEM